MNEKVLNEWLARLEEAVKNYHIHKNNDWLEQTQISRKKIKAMFEEQNGKTEFWKKRFFEENGKLLNCIYEKTM